MNRIAVTLVIVVMGLAAGLAVTHRVTGSPAATAETVVQPRLHIDDQKLALKSLGLVENPAGGKFYSLVGSDTEAPAVIGIGPDGHPDEPILLAGPPSCEP